MVSRCVQWQGRDIFSGLAVSAAAVTWCRWALWRSGVLACILQISFFEIGHSGEQATTAPVVAGYVRLVMPRRTPRMLRTRTWLRLSDAARLRQNGTNQSLEILALCCLGCNTTSIKHSLDIPGNLGEPSQGFGCFFVFHILV